MLKALSPVLTRIVWGRVEVADGGTLFLDRNRRDTRRSSSQTSPGAAGTAV